MNKVEVIKIATELKVPLDITWSCYQDIEKPCGKCKSCKKREDALGAPGVAGTVVTVTDDDATEFADEPY